MNNNYPLFPDDRNRQFGNANDLDTTGGVFDSYNDEESLSENSAPPRSRKKAAGSSEKRSSDDKSDNRRKDSGEKNTGKKGLSAKIKVLALLMIVAAVIAGVVYLNSIVIFGNLFGQHDVFSTGVSEIDLSGTGYSDYSKLSRFKSLEVVDLTGAGIKDLSDLYGCKSLKTVTMADRLFSAEECIEFYKKLPQAHIVCTVDINGKKFSSETQKLKVSDSDANSLRLYGSLNKLTVLDLSDYEVTDSIYASLTETIPDCLIVFNTELNGTVYSTDAKTVKLKGTVSEDDVKKLGYFRNLEMIDVFNCDDFSALDDFTKEHQDVRLNVPMTFLDKTVGRESEVIDLRGSTYTLDEVMAALEANRSQMHFLKKIDMCGCGLSNAEMAELCKAYPDIKFVWMLNVVNGRWYVRTDAVVFSTLTDFRDLARTYTDRDFAEIFTYCTDLVAVDMGHTHVSDMSLMANDKKIRAVIFTDTAITDITPFMQLKDLEFIEMNANRVASVEPLRGLKKLKYINLYSSMGITDLSALYNHESLELCLFHRTIAPDVRKEFQTSNPNCETYYTADGGKVTTNEAWRKNPYRTKVKKAFTNWEYVVGFDETTGEYIYDFNTDQYKYI